MAKRKTNPEFFDKIDALADEISQAHDADVFVLAGDIEPSVAQKVMLSLSIRPRRRKNLFLMLATFGGDADAAYRIGRALQRAYNTKRGTDDEGEIILFVPSYCKSAGTLLAIAADRLVMADDSELGPVDVQLRKQDEIGERVSGLTPTQAVESLQGISQDSFKKYFNMLRFDSELGFSTRMASQIATEITIGVMKPIYEQIDPARLAEVERLLRIATEYGERLDFGNSQRGSASGNLKPGALAKLLAQYPSHGFVIDKLEAKTLFDNIGDCDVLCAKLSEEMSAIIRFSLDREPFAYYLGSPPSAPQDAEVPEAAAGGSEGVLHGEEPKRSDSERDTKRTRSGNGTRSKGDGGQGPRSEGST